MQIQINATGLKSSETIDNHVEKELEHAIGRFGERITRVEVHLHDENAHRHGDDKKCTLEARPAGHKPVTVSHECADLYEAIKSASSKLQHALDHMFGKLDAR